MGFVKIRVKIEKTPFCGKALVRVSSTIERNTLFDRDLA